MTRREILRGFVAVGVVLSMAAPAFAVDDAGSTYVEASEAGDLDGDGGDDLFVTGGGAVRAVHGRDGSTMWTLPGSAHVSPAVELTGASPAEVIAFEYAEPADEPGEVAGVVVHRYRERVTVRILSGDDGRALWTLPIEEVTEYYGLVVRRVTDQFRSVSNMADADGDGLRDVVVLTTDHSFAGDVVSARTYRGADGTPIGVARIANEEYQQPLVLPAGDVSGDGLADLVAVERGLADDRVVALSASGDVHWTTEFRGGVGSIQVEPLTGKGRSDVLVYAYGASLPSPITSVVPSEPNATIALRGTDGSQLWRADDTFLSETIGDADGEGGMDLLVEAGEWEVIGETQTLVARTERVLSGATLDEIWSKRFDLPEPETGKVWRSDFCCALRADLDGDGVVDPILSFEYGDAYSCEDECVPPAPDRTITRALDGRSGRALWKVRLPGHEPVPQAFPGDPDGDGDDDVSFEMIDPSTPGFQDVTVQMADGVSLEPLWSAHVGELWSEDEIDTWTLRTLVLDLDGNGSDEVVVETHDYPGYSRSEVRAFGRGGALWSIEE